MRSRERGWVKGLSRASGEAGKVQGAGGVTPWWARILASIFRVDVFDASRKLTEGVLQNALIRFGADHLRQVRDAAISDRYRTAADVVAGVLLQPRSERFLTSLAPVLLRSSEDLSLPALQADLVRAGRPHRLPWLVENTVAAIDTLSSQPDSPRWKKRALRARLVLAEFLDHLPTPAGGPDTPPRDALDPALRTHQSLEQTWESASAISRKWRVVSAAQVEDFADALRQARELH